MTQYARSRMGWVLEPVLAHHTDVMAYKLFRITGHLHENLPVNFDLVFLGFGW